MISTDAPQTASTWYPVESWLAWRRDGKRFIVAVFAAFLFLRSTAGSYWSAENRFFLHWRTLDTLGIFGAILLTGLMFFISWRVLDRLGRVGRWMGDAAFVFIVLQYARVNIAESLLEAEMLASWGVWTLRASHVALLALFLVMRRRIVGGLRNGCLLLSPILLVYAWTLLNALSYEQIARNRRVQSEWPSQTAFVERDSADRGILLVVFDEWSYARVFEEDGTVRSGFPELSRAVTNGIVFTRASAPGAWTIESLPQMLAGQQGNTYIDTNGVLRFEKGGKERSFTDYDTVFSDFRKRDYRTVMIGCYLPYADLIGADADVCVSYDLYRFMGTSPPALAANSIVENIRIRLSFVHPVIGWPANYIKHRYFVRIAETIHELTLRALRLPEPFFAVVHHSVPHMPFIFERDGSREQLHNPATLQVDDYMGNLYYTDSLLGEIVDAARARPGGGPLIVFTSDHGFREDPMWEGLSGDNLAEKHKHVPLIVLPPGYKGKKVIDTPFELISMRGVLVRWADTGEWPESGGFDFAITDKEREENDDDRVY